jgi:hypothetical protein
MKQLIAVGSVVMKVGKAVRTFEHGAPLPQMPAAEQERLKRLGAAREAIVEGDAKTEPPPPPPPPPPAPPESPAP